MLQVFGRISVVLLRQEYASFHCVFIYLAKKERKKNDIIYASPWNDAWLTNELSTSLTSIKSKNIKFSSEIKIA